MTADAHALEALYKGRKFTKEFVPNGEFQGVVKSIWESEEEEGKFYARVYYPADGDREDILVSELKELLNKPKSTGAKREGRGKKRAAPSTEGVPGGKKKKGSELKAEKKKVGAAAAAPSAAAVVELDDADEPAQPGEIGEERQGDEGSVGTIGPDGHKETEGEEEEQQDEDSQKQPEVAPETQGKTGGATVQGICEEEGEGMEEEEEEERVEAIGGSAEVMAEEGGGDKGGQKGGRKGKGEDGVGAAEGRAVDEDVEAMVEGPKKRKRAVGKEEEQHEREQGDGGGGKEGGQSKKNEEPLEISDSDVPSFTLRKRGGDVEKDHQGRKRDEKKKAKREKHGSRAAHAVLDADAAAEEEMDEKPKSRKHASKQQQPEKKEKANKQDKNAKKKKAREQSDVDIYVGRKLKEVEQELVGRTLVKLFGDDYYRGKITEIWQDDQGVFMAHVVYEDGDEEDEAAAVAIKLLQ